MSGCVKDASKNDAVRNVDRMRRRDMKRGVSAGTKKTTSKKQDRPNGNHLETGTCKQKKEKAQRVRNTFLVIPQKMLT